MKKNLIYTIAALFALSIVVLIALNTSCTKNQVSCSVSSSWRSSKTIGYFEGNTTTIRFEPTKVVVVYKNQKVGDINSENPLIIDISDKDFGPLGMPLFKKGSYNIMVSVNHVKEINTSTSKGKIEINGDIKIVGKYSILGTTSTKTANSMIIDKALNTIYTVAKKEINKIEDEAISGQSNQPNTPLMLPKEEAD